MVKMMELAAVPLFFLGSTKLRLMHISSFLVHVHFIPNSLLLPVQVQCSALLSFDLVNTGLYLLVPSAPFHEGSAPPRESSWWHHGRLH